MNCLSSCFSSCFSLKRDPSQNQRVSPLSSGTPSQATPSTSKIFLQYAIPLPHHTPPTAHSFSSIPIHESSEDPSACPEQTNTALKCVGAAFSTSLTKLSPQLSIEILPMHPSTILSIEPSKPKEPLRQAEESSSSTLNNACTSSITPAQNDPISEKSQKAPIDSKPPSTTSRLPLPSDPLGLHSFGSTPFSSFASSRELPFHQMMLPPIIPLAETSALPSIPFPLLNDLIPQTTSIDLSRKASLSDTKTSTPPQYKPQSFLGRGLDPKSQWDLTHTSSTDSSFLGKGLDPKSQWDLTRRPSMDSK